MNCRLSNLSRSAAFALVTALGACSSPNPYVGVEKQLAAQSANIEAGKLRAATQALEKIVVQADPSDAGARTQALYAAYLMAQAHANASLRAAFLAEPRAESGLGGGASSESGVGHVVALSMYSALGRGLSANADQLPREVKGVKLLPASFDDFRPVDVRANLSLCQLVALSRLGFEERVREFVSGSPDMHNFDTTIKLLDRLRVPSGLSPWILQSSFEFLRRSEATEPEAYKFAVQALIASADSRGAFDQQHRDALSNWIREGSKFEYRCPDHRVLVQPELGRCQELGCSRKLHEFTPQLKSR